MAKGILGKPRTPPQAQGISKPYLQSTDSLPRRNPRDIDRGVSYSRPTVQVVKFGPSEESNRSPCPNFEFRAAVPLSKSSLASDDHLEVDESMIGIALGSPRMLESQNIGTAQRIPPPTPPDTMGPSSALRRKQSKWKKIGGLFKAKNAMGPVPNKPFYQVRAAQAGPQQGSTHSVDYKSRRGPGIKAEPIENTEVWPCLASENEALTHQNRSKPQAGTFLQVEIPQVEMERYSVMFGGLLNRSQPSLLDRRSKTLDNLTIPGQEPSPPVPQRRATSPALSRSPNFSLFPTTMPASKATKVLGTHNLSQASISRSRSQTSPADPQGTLSPQRDLTPDIRSKATHRSQDSVTSFLSSTTIGSDDEHLLIHKIEPVRTFAGMKEPNWQIINPKPPTSSQTDSAFKTKLTINTQEIHSRSDSTDSSESTITARSFVSSASSPILSPLNATRPGASPPRTHNGPNANIRIQPTEQKPGSVLLPPPRSASRPLISKNSSQSSSYSHNTSDSQTEIPTIEVSIARSVSVSKGKKQMIVPVRARAPTFTSSNERLVAHQARTPKVSGPQIGHRPGVSQDARIEMV